MHGRNISLAVIDLLTVIVLLAGCGPQQSSPAITSVATKAPTVAVAPTQPTVAPTPVPPTATLTPAPSKATPTPVLPSPTPMEVPPKTIQGVLFDAKTGGPLAGVFDVVVGWDFVKDSQTGGIKGNLLFIDGKPEGKLVTAPSGEFILQNVELFGVSTNNRIFEAKEDQLLMIAIRGGSLQETTTLRDQSGKPITFVLPKSKGVFLGKVYVMP